MRWDERLAVPLLGVLVVAIVFYFATPHGRWFTVEAVDAHDTAAGEVVKVDYRREIHRDFTGRWWAHVRKDGVPFCDGSDTDPYRVDSEREPVVKLSWITEGGCPDILPCGTYDLRVEWVVWPESSFIWRRHVAAMTDEFVVICPEGASA